MSRQALQKAVDVAGGQAGLAREIRRVRPDTKIGQPHVWGWLNSVESEVPPSDITRALSEAIGWEVTPHELRPDIYPNPTDALPPGIAAQVASGIWPACRAA